MPSTSKSPNFPAGSYSNNGFSSSKEHMSSKNKILTELYSNQSRIKVAMNLSKKMSKDGSPRKVTDVSNKIKEDLNQIGAENSRNIT